MWLPRGRGLGLADVTLLCMEWMNNKVLLYSMGNYIRYPMINHNGKKIKRMCVCVCVCVCVCIVVESLFCTVEINTTL